MNNGRETINGSKRVLPALVTLTLLASARGGKFLSEFFVPSSSFQALLVGRLLVSLLICWFRFGFVSCLFLYNGSL